MSTNVHFCESSLCAVLVAFVPTYSVEQLEFEGTDGVLVRAFKA